MRALANRMVADHTAASAKLKQVVSKEMLAAPSDQLDAKHKAILEELNNRDEASFDKAYLDAQHKVHLDAIDLFKAYAKGSDNAAVVVGPGSVAGTWESVDPRVGRLLGPGDRIAMHPSPAERIELLASAGCLLAPLTGMWPFCSAMTEALACGTPVVALRRGAATEIVEHGVTGWLCDHPAELAGAVARVGRLDRRACRQQALDRFDLPRMADELETAYQAVVRSVQRHIIASGPALGA